MKILFIVITFVFISFNSLYGQLSVQPSNPVSNKLETMVLALAGPNVQVSNIRSNRPSGSHMYGKFTEPSGSLGIKKGLLMTTASVENALGPNFTTSMSGEEGLSGDPDLSALVGDRTYDACVIEFDIVTTSTEISFNYIFGSEEYIDFVGMPFNDVFAFLISGPGIVGKKNIALIPGTNTPVAINNVNPDINAAYYLNNTTDVVQYNGYTVKLKAVTQVRPCNTYHLKLAIADVGDDLYDSGVFIEEGSLSGSEGLILGDVTTKAEDSTHVCASIFPLKLKAGQYDLPNYTWTKDGIVVATGSQFYNATSNGWYKVKAYNDGGTCFWEDSIKVTSDPDITLVVSPDTAICSGGTASLSVNATGSSGYSYLWSPASFLSDATIANPVSTPTNSITYTVTVTAGLCSRQQLVNVSIVAPLHLQATTAIDGCVNQEVQLQASGAEQYRWSPAANLNDPDIANPLAVVSSNTVFKVVGSNKCHRDSVDVTVTIYPFPVVQAYGDTTICYGGTAQLNSDIGVYQYLWSPAASLSSATINNPVASPLENTDYILSVSNHGCIKKNTVQIKVKEQVKAQIISPVKHVQIPEKVQFKNGSMGASDYTWYFTRSDSTKIAEPVFDFKNEEYYTVILKATNVLGCIDYDTTVVLAYHLFIPNLITPNEDGKNDNFQITSLGDQFELEIYTRWGDRVYKKSNYKNEWTGEGLSDGIYYFVIYDSFLNKDYKGWVQLLR